MSVVLGLDKNVVSPVSDPAKIASDFVPSISKRIIEEKEMRTFVLYNCFVFRELKVRSFYGTFHFLIGRLVNCHMSQSSENVRLHFRRKLQGV